MARAMWKRKHLADQLPKLQNLSMSPLTASVEDTLSNLPDDIRGECILAIKSKRNDLFRNNKNNSQQNYSNNQGSYNGQAKNKNKGQNNQKQKNKNTGNSITTPSRVGTVAKRDTHKLSVEQELEKTNQ
jgi:hypothetical protein